MRTTEDVSILETIADKVYQDLSIGIITSNNDGIILNVNSAAESILGSQKALLIGKHLTDILITNDSSRFESQLLKLLEFKSDTLFGEAKLNRSFGPDIWIRYSLKLHSNNTISINFQEITELILKIEELTSRNLGKDNLFSIITHEMKNSFNVILGLTELLKNNTKVGQDNSLYGISELLNIKAKHSYRLLENLLAWSYLQIGRIKFQPENINVKELIEEEISNLQINAQQKGISINSEISDDIIFSDKFLLATILRNLLSNAIKFSIIGGVVDIKFQSFIDYHEFVVTDYGMGMDDDTKSKLFKPEFVVTKLGTDKESGSGFGLLLCRELVDLHKGKIWVVSEAGKGSQFTFIIPNSGISI